MCGYRARCAELACSSRTTAHNGVQRSWRAPRQRAAARPQLARGAAYEPRPQAGPALAASSAVAVCARSAGVDAAPPQRARLRDLGRRLAALPPAPAFRLACPIPWASHFY